MIVVKRKYTRAEQLTPEILNALVDKIVAHEAAGKDGNTTEYSMTLSFRLPSNVKPFLSIMTKLIRIFDFC